MSETKKKKRMPNWLLVAIKVIEWAIIIVIVVCMLNLLSQKMVGQTPSLFGYSIYTVVTPSMEPTYNVGDVVICKNIKNPEDDISQFKKGDVVAFIAPTGFQYIEQLEGLTVTHRIEEEPHLVEGKEGYFILTKGDNAPDVDNVKVPVENIKGKIVGTNSFVTKLVAFLTKWYGFVTIIVIPLFVILFLQVRILVKEKQEVSIKKMEEEKQRQINELLEEVKKELEGKDGIN